MTEENPFEKWRRQLENAAWNLAAKNDKNQDITQAKLELEERLAKPPATNSSIFKKRIETLREEFGASPTPKPGPNYRAAAHRKGF